MALLGIVLVLCAVLVLSAASWLPPDMASTHHFEKWLHDFLTGDYRYGVDVRPALNASDVVDVNFGLSIINLIDVDDTMGLISANYRLRYLWRDVRLQWNSSRFGDIGYTHIPVGRLWRPDLVLYNSAFEKTAIMNMATLAVVSSDGYVLVYPRAILSTTCTFDMTWFPYDEQTCSIKVGSWTYDGFMLNPNFFNGVEEIGLTDYIAHNEWEIIGHGAKKNVKYYPCCKEPYPDLTFTLSLRRRSSYFTQMYVVPGVILALVTPFIFTLPVNKPHRYILGASLMITIAVITSNFDGTVPVTFGTPLLGRWFTGLQTIISIALILSAIISNLAEKSANGQHPPYFVMAGMVDIIGRLLCIKRGLLHMRSMDEDEGSESRSASTEWFLVARVLDRLFFFVYSVIFLLMFILFSVK